MHYKCTAIELQLSSAENSEENRSLKERFGQITIRGVDRSLYGRLSRLARRMGVNVGTLINQSMELFLSVIPQDGGPRLPRGPLNLSAEFMRGFLEGLGHIIEDIEELSMSKKDLLEADRELVFVRIGLLEFEDDVDRETFRSRVRAIYHCKEVVIPETLPKVLVLSVSRGIGRIVVRGRESK